MNIDAFNQVRNYLLDEYQGCMRISEVSFFAGNGSHSFSIYEGTHPRSFRRYMPKLRSWGAVVIKENYGRIGYPLWRNVAQFNEDEHLLLFSSALSRLVDQMLVQVHTNGPREATITLEEEFFNRGPS